MKDESPIEEVLKDIAAKAKILHEERDKMDKPTECECKTWDGIRRDYYPAVDDTLIRCDWCKARDKRLTAAEAEVERLKEELKHKRVMTMSNTGNMSDFVTPDHPGIKHYQGRLKASDMMSMTDNQRNNSLIAEVERLDAAVKRQKAALSDAKRFTRAEEVCEWLEQHHTHGGSRVLQPQLCDTCKVLVAWMEAKNGNQGT